MMQIMCRDSQVDEWCKQLLQSWEGATIASRDISLQYWDAWRNLVDVALSTAVANSMSSWHFLDVLLTSTEIFYQYWTSVHTAMSLEVGVYIHSLIKELLGDLRPPNYRGEWQMWLQESDAKLQRLLASYPLSNTFIYLYIYTYIYAIINIRYISS